MTPSIEPHQHTLKRAVSCCGVGLHTGRTVNLTIRPAAAHSGIRFLRSDLPGQPVIPARVEQVVDTTLATTIGKGAARIATTEHLLAALHGSGIDNAEIDLDSHEVPIMDGSAGPFIHLLKSAGIRGSGPRAASCASPGRSASPTATSPSASSPTTVSGLPAASISTTP